ncbi:hypothetical protein EC957_008067 [Mortierella hygrophila]|uniref:Uncharacterized protein n=1 Tax=Mortierella hygrophila TaxID=979708 RepID=A0A9P6JY88_9FUNG|nr:hypothetical protein EC957_008067 [Mortierella hygrophila]
MVFPFIERYYGGHPDWLQWTLNIMTNKLDNHNRPLTNRIALPAQFLQQFRPDEQSEYSRHHLFAHPLFKSVAFQMFSRDLSTAMDDAAPPRSDSLRLNAPALEHKIRNLDTKITDGLKHLNRHFDDTIDNLTTKFQSCIWEVEPDIQFGLGDDTSGVCRCPSKEFTEGGGDIRTNGHYERSIIIAIHNPFRHCPTDSPSECATSPTKALSELE